MNIDLEGALNESGDEWEWVYGPFHGGDPRDFFPDEECCTAEEIERHRLACEAWEKGEQVDRGPSCATQGDGSIWDGTGFGIGTHRYRLEVT